MSICEVYWHVIKHKKVWVVEDFCFIFCRNDALCIIVCHCVAIISSALYVENACMSFLVDIFSWNNFRAGKKENSCLSVHNIVVKLRDNMKQDISAEGGFYFSMKNFQKLLFASTLGGARRHSQAGRGGRGGGRPYRRRQPEHRADLQRAAPLSQPTRHTNHLYAQASVTSVQKVYKLNVLRNTLS